MEEILQFLLERSGQYISGEALARRAGITRAGIWKQIEQLRALGFTIESAPRKGYRLTGGGDALLPVVVKDGLRTERFGRSLRYQFETDSTNSWARRQAEAGEPEGTVLVAETQRQGRGRMGRAWSSTPGKGLWFSMILRPRLSAADLAGLMTLTAVSMARAIAAVTGTAPDIKWPNDILYRGRKLVGILAEMKGELDWVNYLVIGIGVNVNHEAADFPPELADRAGSLRQIAGRNFSRAELLREFLAEFERAYDDVPANGLAAVIQYAREHSATLGREVTVSQGFGRTITGMALDLAEDGSLLLRDHAGELLRLSSGELIAGAAE
ncbi:BirA family biotin operon repressor/biotin-[acetyl-CoA-carboxylase] ligase [Hydrogenispora ethanolica]|jgi:BirA family biotin operon repressor/biotin-[acetyl-CoA-carboxylase] ligase|uniref:Bifunctional ligase/repressor BirA n=1 Tax=Hydrogenispora ethanolica TaxID=1082276 RepID=A0A4R1RYG6_HYDET|nr:biotin--[acetyl-CoA-carboxylase] ligase [Hydrogenispora ethanolica]TCL71619.1 BirA family biotin operon repressor/biotin-[acetyl-CoA-carboxylase] ligase [Hydrogenispora ethanolica]